jgi:hypothetical protein
VVLTVHAYNSKQLFCGMADAHVPCCFVSTPACFGAASIVGPIAGVCQVAQLFTVRLCATDACPFAVILAVSAVAGAADGARSKWWQQGCVLRH